IQMLASSWRERRTRQFNRRWAVAHGGGMGTWLPFAPFVAARNGCAFFGRKTDVRKRPAILGIRRSDRLDCAGCPCGSARVEERRCADRQSAAQGGRYVAFQYAVC